MKQTDPKQLERSYKEMEALKEIRGGELLPFHRKLANDAQLLGSFKDIFVSCNRGDNIIPTKYRELMIMLLGCTRGIETTIKVHAKKAAEAGATIQEIGETLRLAMMICGVSAVIPAAAIFDELADPAGDI